MLKKITINLFNSIRIRNYIIARNYVPRYGRSQDPGIESRKEDFGEMILENENDPEFLDSLEADFSNLPETHREYERERRMEKEHISSSIVGRKYFQQKTPNFITFKEKEQIQQLHESDPEKYSILNLSNSFPADPQGINHIIRFKRKPKNTKVIDEHDMAVKRNWIAFKEGKLKVEPRLAEHLKKFASRDLSHVGVPQPFKRLGVQVPKPASNEFLSIITTCSKYKEVDEKEAPTIFYNQKQRVRKIESEELRMPEIPEDSEENSVVMEGRQLFSKKNITLEEFQKKAPEYKLTDVQEIENKEIEEFNYNRKLKSVEERGVMVKADQIYDRELLEIREKIRIPKKLYQRGKIFQVNDCFYDDDGEFLYRVPGLTNL